MGNLKEANGYVVSWKKKDSSTKMYCHYFHCWQVCISNVWESWPEVIFQFNIVVFWNVLQHCSIDHDRKWLDRKPSNGLSSALYFPIFILCVCLCATNATDFPGLCSETHVRKMLMHGIIYIVVLFSHNKKHCVFITCCLEILCCTCSTIISEMV